ncbi:multidrug effflux MFS transporter [Cochlodiniinecator piscidefendens]|uniref:multidrug effflux MFS transporter n=1 Tax=Cochlodiniinecator piscidefendens TaxID=2715756 RepID=UPI00140DE862|nr:multidrug effflux MFS transporter [Cochlodiniinecator piscidefendens]
MSKLKTPPHLITLILLTGFSPLSLNMFLPSLANIAVDFGANYKTASIAVSGYLALTAVVQIIIGPLSDKIGRRPVLLSAVLIFAIASIGCVLAQDITTFLIFRMLQGGMVAGYTLSMAIVRDTHSEREAVSLIGYIGMSMAIAPMVGPMFGGLLDTFFGWRSIFIFYAMSGAVLFFLCWVDLGETQDTTPSQSTPQASKIGVLLRDPQFWAFSLCGASSVGAFYIFLTGAPLVALSEFGVTTAELGIYIGTITLGFMAGGFLTGRFGSKFELTTMMLIGRIVACLGLLVGSLLIFQGFQSPQFFFASTIFVGLGNGLTMPGSNTGAMSVRPNLAGSAAGLNGALIVAGGAALTTLTGIIMPEENGSQTLLMLMLGASGMGLCFAVWAVYLTKQRSLAS